MSQFFKQADNLHGSIGLSLTALCGCFDPPVSKSGLSHRMKKLEALAETLRQNLEQEANA